MSPMFSTRVLRGGGATRGAASAPGRGDKEAGSEGPEPGAGGCGCGCGCAPEVVDELAGEVD